MKDWLTCLHECVLTLNLSRAKEASSLTIFLFFFLMDLGKRGWRKMLVRTTQFFPQGR